MEPNFYTRAFAKIKNGLLDFLFPIECVGCKKPKTYCCEKCFEEIPKIEAQAKATKEKRANPSVTRLMRAVS